MILETKKDLDHCIKFNVNYFLYEDELNSQEKMKLACAKTPVLEEVCSFVKQWSKQITTVSVNSINLMTRKSGRFLLAILSKVISL